MLGKSGATVNPPKSCVLRYPIGPGHACVRRPVA
jgi:hypothetical protein